MALLLRHFNHFSHFNRFNHFAERKPLDQKFRNLLWYSVGIFTLSFIYFIYVWLQAPVVGESETFLTEIGEGLGTAALWAIVFIYGRTLLKLLIGKGKLSQRLIPESAHTPAMSVWKKVLRYLNRTHAHVGIATLALIGLHILFVGFDVSNLFFVAVLLLIVWQGMFGLFLRWRYSPTELKKFSHLVHAQFATGIAIGIFGWFGHLLVG